MACFKNITYSLLLILMSAMMSYGQGPATFNIGSASGQVGDIICVDVTVEGFVNVASLEWFNRWDPNVVRLDTILVDESCLNEDGQNLFPSIAFNQVPGNDKFGKLTWFDSGATGVTADDGCILYQLCFELIGDPCESSIINITGGDNEIGVEISLDDYETLELDQSDIIINSGQITIDPAGFMITESHCSSDDSGDTGSITFSGSGGTGPYSWTINLMGGGFTESNVPGEEIADCEAATVDDLAPGTYNVVFTDANGVIRIEIITIETNSSFPFVVTLDPSDPRCFSKNNGEISIDNLEGGEGPFTYAWSNSQFTESLEDLFPGDYSLTVTDVNGCSTSASTTLAVDTIKVEAVIVSDPSCDGSSDGIVSIFATGGTPYETNRYDFDIDGCAPTFYIGNGNQETSPYSRGDFFDGCFNVVVSDSLNCNSEPVKFCLEAGSFSTLTIDSMNVSCFGECDGTVLITPAQIGNFSFQVTDQQGNPLVGVNSNNISYSAENICPGKYNVTVTDNLDGCFIDTMFIIAEPEALTVMVDSVGPGCSGNDGMITFNPMGGTSPYTFEWDDAFDQGTRDNLGGGSYSVTIEDANECSHVIAWTFAEGGSIGLNAGVLTAVNCESDADGSIIATVSSAGSFTFSWENSDGDNIGQTAQIDNLGGGIYYVTATDGMCSGVDSVILAPGLTPAASVVMMPPSCLTSTNGMLTATLTEGTAPANFEWSMPPSAAIISTGPVVIGPVGDYNLKIVDDNGCEFDTIFSIEPPTNLIEIDIANLTENPCFGSCNSSATFTASGGPAGIGDYTFIINGDPTPAPGGVLNVNNLCGGNNFIIAIDGICSSDTMFFDVVDATEIMIDQTNSIINPPSCSGELDGNIDVVVIGGNDSNYDLLWINEGISGSALSNLGDGQYILAITDGQGCMQNDTIDLFTPDPLMLEVNPLLVSNCFSDSTGRIELFTSGGNAGNITYEWSPNVSTSSSAVNLPPGMYSITATDVNGCQDSISYELTSAPPIVANIPTPIDPNCFGGQTCIQIENVTGGVGNEYSYTVVNGQIPIPIDSCFEVFAGEYNITVFDSSGCSIDTVLTINQPSQILVDAGEDVTINLGTETDPVSTFIVSELDIDSITWTPNIDIDCNTIDCQIVTFSPNSTTTYTVTVTDENGCLATDDITVIVDLARNVFTPNIFSPNFDNVNDLFQIAVGDGVSIVNYLKIYDRWGNAVFLDENYLPNDMESRGWDGTFNGVDSEAGVYVFFAEVAFVDGAVVMYKGDVTLVR